MKADAESARVTLRQICGLGLPAPVLLPSLLPALRAVVPASHGAFFYCDAAGQMVNMYAERMLAPELMSQYYDSFYDEETTAFSKAYLRRVRAPDPVSYRTLSAEERNSNYYREILSKLGVGHVMYAIVRSVAGNGSTGKQEAIGQLSLYRGDDERPFKESDAAALRDVLHYLGRVLVSSPYVKATTTTEHVAEEAMAVLDPKGAIIYSDESWTRLIRLARGEPISPAKAKSENALIAEFLKGVTMVADSAKNTSNIVNSPWGRFSFRRYQLVGADGKKVSAMTVSRLSVDTVSLTEGAARLSLSAQQREVALMIALGHSNIEIAERLNITVNTASYHVKQLFTKLGVHNRTEVGALLRQA
jgi:DNA-binding CsgD family transcriptional regulator